MPILIARLGRWLLGAAFLALALLVAAPAQAASDEHNAPPDAIVIYTQEAQGIDQSMVTRGRTRDGPAARLRAKASQGPIRLIVGLRVTNNPRTERRIGKHRYDPASLARVQAGVERRVRGRLGAHASHRYRFIPFMTMTVTGRSLDRLLADPDVVSIQEDVAAPLPPFVAEPTFRRRLTESIPIIGANRLWAKRITGTGIAIAVLDTGVQSGHPMFKDKIVAEACFSTTIAGTTRSLCPGGAASSTVTGSGVNCVGPALCNHGTHVAGIAAGNSPTLKGVAKDADIIAIQIFSLQRKDADCGGPGTAPCIGTFPSDQVKAMEHVLSLAGGQTIAAVNLSISAPGTAVSSACDAEEPARTAQFEALRAAGIAVVVSAGNEGLSTGINRPACIGAATAVGATTDADTVAALSNMADNVDLMAPGVNIKSANPFGGVLNQSGTSMAAPHVSGAFALLRQATPEASVDEIEASLNCTGVLVTRRVPGSTEKIIEPRIGLEPAHRVLIDRKTPIVWNFDSPLEANAWKSFSFDKFRIAGGKLKLTNTGDNFISSTEEFNEVLSRVRNCFERFVVDVDFRIDVGTGIPAVSATNIPVYMDKISNTPVRVLLHAGVDGTFGLTTGYGFHLWFENRQRNDRHGSTVHYLNINVGVFRFDIVATGDPHLPFTRVREDIDGCRASWDFAHEVSMNNGTVIADIHRTDYAFAPQGSNNVKFLSDGLRTVVKINDFKLCEFTDRKYLFGSVGLGFGVGLKTNRLGDPYVDYLPPMALEKVIVRRLNDGESID